METLGEPSFFGLYLAFFDGFSAIDWGLKLESNVGIWRWELALLGFGFCFGFSLSSEKETRERKKGTNWRGVVGFNLMLRRGSRQRTQPNPNFTNSAVQRRVDSDNSGWLGDFEEWLVGSRRMRRQPSLE